MKNKIIINLENKIKILSKEMEAVNYILRRELEKETRPPAPKKKPITKQLNK